MTDFPWRTVAAVMVLALAARAAAAVPLRFPALDDPAYHLTVARNLAEGRGLVIDAVWSYLVPFTSVTHPSNEYWMPLAALALAPVFWLFGTDFAVAQAFGALAGALLVLPAMATAALLAPDHRRTPAALAAGAAAALNPLLVYQSVVPDSAVVFALVGSAALWWCAPPFGRPAGGPLPLRLALRCGLLLGLAYLARADGLLLLPIVLWYAQRQRTPPAIQHAGVHLWRHAASTLSAPAPAGADRPAQTDRVRSAPGLAAAAVVGGFVCIALPWWVRQTLVFGSPFPVAATVPALIPDYPALFAWPAPTPQDLVQSTGLLRQATLRGEGLAHNTVDVAGPVLGGLLPFVALGILALRHRAQAQPALIGAAALYAGSALLFPVPTMHGTFYHAFGAVLPALIGVGVAGMCAASDWWDTRRGWKRSVFWPLAAGVLILTAGQTTALMAHAMTMHAQWERQFAVAGRWLRHQPAGVVMTTQPHSLNYATGIPAFMLPASQPPDVALEVARRFDARYLVLTERFGRYPEAVTPPPAGFRLAHDGDGIRVYEVSPP